MIYQQDLRLLCTKELSTKVATCNEGTHIEYLVPTGRYEQASRLLAA